MTQLQVFKIVADMVKEGRTNDEVRKALFSTKGVRVAQIAKAMALLSAD